MINKTKRNYRNIGIQHYSFDIGHEKLIYKYLSMDNLNNIELKKLNESEKFDSYLDWKQYVWNKYSEYDSDGLKQFEKYLKRGANNVAPTKEYWNVAYGAILAWTIGESTKEIIHMLSEILNVIGIAQIIIAILALIIISLVLIFVIKKITKPIWDNSEEENFYNDYIEIIRQIIQKKEPKYERNNG